MNGITVSIIELFMKGIPETLLIVFAIHALMNIKIDTKKFCILCILGLITTYLIRLLPINVGVNSILLLIAWVVFSQVLYKLDISKILKLILSVFFIILLIFSVELINMVLLNAYFGEAEAAALWNSDSAWTRSLASLPATVFFGIFILISWLVVKSFRKHKEIINGKSSQKISA